MKGSGIVWMRVVEWWIAEEQRSLMRNRVDWIVVGFSLPSCFGPKRGWKSEGHRMRLTISSRNELLMAKKQQ